MEVVADERFDVKDQGVGVLRERGFELTRRYTEWCRSRFLAPRFGPLYTQSLSKSIAF